MKIIINIYGHTKYTKHYIFSKSDLLLNHDNNNNKSINNN